MDSFTLYLIGLPALLVLSILASKGAGRIGIPSLLIFLLVGMIAGKEGPFGFPFSNYLLAQDLGILALILILYSGGLDTSFEGVREIAGAGLALSTIGVLVATALVGWFAVWYLKLPLLQGLLLGATISATDVAAVFTILRSRNVSLKGRIGPVLELESAANDPMTIFLAMGMLALITRPTEVTPLGLIPMFFQQMALGTVFGFIAGKGTRALLNRVRLEFEGLYPVLSLALVLLTYGITQLTGGSGFLAVYVSGIVLGNSTFLHKRSLTLFHDGLAWLMQIAMFLTMGLLVLPSELSKIAVSGIVLSLFLVFVARPLSVIVCLLPFRFNFREINMVTWGGLRGAVPIVLAMYPLLANVPGAKLIFELVFFIVFTSVLIQGPTIPAVSKFLKVALPPKAKFRYPIEYNPTSNLKSELVEVPVPDRSSVIGRALVDLTLPAGSLVVLIHRGDDVIVPRGGTHIEADDKLLVLADQEALMQIRHIVAVKKSAGA